MVDIGLAIRVRHDYGDKAEEMAALDGRLTAAMQQGTAQGLRVLEREAQQTINRRSGRTAGTIKREMVRTPDGASGRVYSDDEIARILEYGSRPHVIRPRKAKALRFEANGETVFAKVVHHPGTKAFRWLQRAGYSSERAIELGYQRQVEGVLRS